VRSDSYEPGSARHSGPVSTEEPDVNSPGAGTRVLPRWAVAGVAVAVAVLTTGTVLGLLVWLGELPLAGKDRATAQLDAVKVGLSIGVGGGGVFALYLAARRQRSTELQVWQHERDLEQRLAAQRHAEQIAAANNAHQERVAAATEADAAERRVTELYGKAADQLGSDRAPVRMAGLYALERLAQANPDHRQTVVNVICAYLRMPFEPPDEDSAADGGRREEQHVRDTAVSILVTHLQPYVGIRNTPDDPRFLWREAHTADVPANPKFWPDIDVDLSGATLARADFPSCRFRNAIFFGASFDGGMTHFTGCEFHGMANFNFADFDSIVDFTRARFYDMALFQNTKFAPRSSFGEVRFYAGVGMQAKEDRVYLNRALAWTEPEDTTFNNFLPRGWIVGDPVGDDAPDPVSSTGRWCRIVEGVEDED
jgi:Pentapeptide repeats (8 copies)